MPPAPLTCTIMNTFHHGASYGAIQWARMQSSASNSPQQAWARTPRRKSQPPFSKPPRRSELCGLACTKNNQLVRARHLTVKTDRGIGVPLVSSGSFLRCHLFGYPWVPDDMQAPAAQRRAERIEGKGAPLPDAYVYKIPAPIGEPQEAISRFYVRRFLVF